MEPYTSIMEQSFILLHHISGIIPCAELSNLVVIREKKQLKKISKRSLCIVVVEKVVYQ